MSSEMIILSWWLLFIASRFPHFLISSNIITEERATGYQRIKATEAFEYKNTRGDFKYYY